MIIKQTTNLGQRNITDTIWDQIRFPEWTKNRGWDINEWRVLKKNHYQWDFGQWRSIAWGDTLSFVLRGFVIILVYLMLVMNFTVGMSKIIWKLLVMLFLAPIFNIKMLVHNSDQAQSKRYWNEIKGLVLSYIFCLIGYHFLTVLIQLALEQIVSLNIFKGFEWISWLGNAILTGVICFALTTVFSKTLEKFALFFGLDSGVDLSSGTRFIKRTSSRFVPARVKNSKFAQKFKNKNNSNNSTSSEQTSVSPDSLSTPVAKKYTYQALSYSEVKDFEKQSSIVSPEIQVNVNVQTPTETKTISTKESKG
ncbi:Mbov_0396 family ICE element transmembrane protein [Mycoplasma sp. 3686d]|uniref:Mbov_0396 family ICE element transmembrane protein n=1 Tax=Mycoplasma sp. 3686d TaxID=2967300 RepID=UPI00211C4828|nr:hypothetical protein [Mycoplasma sp. 3686d]UUM24542.1 hypothetical protein NPA12_02470 [Mycoplasma sp. 3686d]